MNKRVVYAITQMLVLLSILGLLLWSRPWQSPTANERKITVTGESVVEETPDSYVFMPSYQVVGGNAQSNIDAISSKVTQVTDGLKKLGVNEEDISLNSSAYNQLAYPVETPSKNATATLTVTVKNKELAQKVQDYLLATNPTGAISPQPTFSEDKQKELAAQARSKAVEDAKKKAEAMAGEIGARVGKVIEVRDGSAGAGVMPIYARDTAASQASSSMPVLPGKHEVRSAVEAVFELR